MVTDPASIARYLAAVGEATDVPRRSPGRGPPYWKRRPAESDMAACLLAGTLLALTVAAPAPDLVRVHVEDDETLTEATRQLEKHIRARGALMLVDDPADADVRVLVLSSGVIGSRGLAVVDAQSPPEILSRQPSQVVQGAEVVDTREYVIVARVTGGDRVDEVRNAPRAAKLKSAAKGLAGEIEAWARKHRLEILASRRSADGP